MVSRAPNLKLGLLFFRIRKSVILNYNEAILVAISVIVILVFYLSVRTADGGGEAN